MKELSIQEKASRYDEAIEKAKQFHDKELFAECNGRLVEYIFPELKESDDERIRKWLIQMVEELRKANPTNADHNGNCSEAIAWLEKQSKQNLANSAKTCKDEQNTNVVIPKFRVGDVIRLKGSCVEYTIKSISDGHYYGKGFSFNIVGCDRDYELVEHNSVDNVEPKFKVGDWVVNNNGEPQLYQVTARLWPDSKIKRVENNLESFINTVTLDKRYHLWTIQDAKDGDVLVCESGERTLECLFIFKLIADREVHEYCSYRTIDKHFSLKDSFLGYVDNVYHPATQEQRDLLFAKMKEAGYEWDAEKKELKKMGHKPAWSEEDENRFRNLIFLVEHSNEGKGTKEGFVKFIYRLKSLRPQSTWKPSDEMLEALYRAIPENVMEISEDEMLLDKLYQGLKYGRVLSEK